MSWLLKLAVKILSKHLKKDEEYFYSWQSNIAVAFQDECARERTGRDYFNRNDIHRISNKAAKNFLNLLIKD